MNANTGSYKGYNISWFKAENIEDLEDEYKHLVRIEELEDQAKGYARDMQKAMMQSDEDAYLKAKQKLTAIQDRIEMHEKYRNYLAERGKDNEHEQY